LYIPSCPCLPFPVSSAVCFERLSRCRLWRPRGMLTIPSSLLRELHSPQNLRSLHFYSLYYADKPDYRSEGELAINIRKATSIEETAPKRKHVRSCIVYTWDHKSSGAFWAGMKVLVLFFILFLF
jgi:hypothetical protein